MHPFHGLLIVFASLSSIPGTDSDGRFGFPPTLLESRES